MVVLVFVMIGWRCLGALVLGQGGVNALCHISSLAEMMIANTKAKAGWHSCVCVAADVVYIGQG